MFFFFFNIFAFVASSLLRPILDRFWVDFGTENRPKIVPKRVFKSVQNQISFLMPSWTDFWSTWPQHGPIWAPKMAPSWDQNGTKIGPKRVSEAMSVPGPIFDRFWTVLGSILGRFWDVFWSILGRFLVDFWVGFVCLASLSATHFHFHFHVFADYRHDLQCLRASRSLLTQVYLGGVFFCFVFGVFFSSLLGGSKTVLEPNMAPTWSDFGAMLATFWSIFGCCFGFST